MLQNRRIKLNRNRFVTWFNRKSQLTSPFILDPIFLTAKNKLLLVFARCVAVNDDDDDWPAFFGKWPFDCRFSSFRRPPKSFLLLFLASALLKFRT